MDSKIEYPGVILQVKGDGIQVRISQKTACADCHARSMCNLSNTEEKIVEIQDNNSGFKAGEEVFVTGATSLGMKAVVIAFLLPMLIVLLLLIVGIQWFESEMIGAVMAISALVGYYIILFFQKNKLTRKFVFTLNRR